MRKFRGLACEVVADADALGPGRAFEWVAALETGTVHYSVLPPAHKRRFNLTMRDTGIDSLALDGQVAVQAKEYNGTVPLSKLASFHFAVRSLGSQLPPDAQMLVVTTQGTRLAPTWVDKGIAQHLALGPDRIERWRAAAARLQRWRRARSTTALTWRDRDVTLWRHQQDCLDKCASFYHDSQRRDFFAEVATAAGKTGIYAELLERLRPRRACIVVPRIDLMEDFQRRYRPDAVRVGTGHNRGDEGVDTDAKLFVCVRASAWRLANLSFDLAIFDEAHHYEPPPSGLDAEAERHWMMGHRGAVLNLQARKRFFFSATLRYHHAQPDFRFSLRQAIEAGRVADYDVTVPIVSEGDVKPCIARLVGQSPHFRRILAFCNTEREADRFAALLRSEGVPAELYSGRTSRAARLDLDRRFVDGGLRVLVTCRVLGEGRDAPLADTCVFVEARSSRVDVAQCIGRVLRLPGKTVAHVVAPACSQGLVFEAWFAALMEADPLVAADVRECPQARVGVVDCHLPGEVDKAESQQDAPSPQQPQSEEDLDAADAAELLAAPVFERLRALTPEAVAALRAGAGGLSASSAVRQANPRPNAPSASPGPGRKRRLNMEEKVQEMLVAMEGRDQHFSANDRVHRFYDGAVMGLFWWRCKAKRSCDEAPHDQLLASEALRKDYYFRRLTSAEKVKEFLAAMEGRGRPIPQQEADFRFSDNTSMGLFWFHCKVGNRCERAPYDQLLGNEVLRRDYHGEGAAFKVKELRQEMQGRSRPIPYRDAETKFSDGTLMGPMWMFCKNKGWCERDPYKRLLANEVLREDYTQ